MRKCAYAASACVGVPREKPLIDSSRSPFCKPIVASKPSERMPSSRMPMTWPFFLLGHDAHLTEQRALHPAHRDGCSRRHVRARRRALCYWWFEELALTQAVSAREPNGWRVLHWIVTDELDGLAGGSRSTRHAAAERSCDEVGDAARPVGPRPGSSPSLGMRPLPPPVVLLAIACAHVYGMLARAHYGFPDPRFGEDAHQLAVDVAVLHLEAQDVERLF